jgi:hypothetical protein
LAFLFLLQLEYGGADEKVKVLNGLLRVPWPRIVSRFRVPRVPTKRRKEHEVIRSK